MTQIILYFEFNLSQGLASKFLKFLGISSKYGENIEIITDTCIDSQGIAPYLILKGRILLYPVLDTMKFKSKIRKLEKVQKSVPKKN